MSWELYKLDDVCDVINGGSWAQDEYVSQGVKVIKVSNLVNDGIDESNMSYLPYESLSVYEKNILKSYDLVVTTVGSHPQLKASAAGRGFVISPVYEGSLLNQNTVCIRTKDENILFNRYLGYVGRSDDFRHFIQQTGRGAANQMRIPISNIKIYALSLPKLHIQKRIASILSAYDDLIENNLKRIKLLEETAQNIYKEWFVNFRFPNYEHTEFDNESGLPVGWEMKKVEDCIKIMKGKKPKKEYSTIGENRILYLLVDVLERRELRFTENESVQLASEGETLMLMDGSRSGLVFKSLDGAIGSTLAVFRIKNAVFGINYCFNFFKFREVEIISKNTGSAIPHANKSYIYGMEMPIPSNKISSEFETITSKIYQQIEVLSTQNQKLKEARDILLPRLMNRTIEV